MGGRSLRQRRKKRSAERFNPRRLFRVDKVSKCSVLKKLELTAQGMVESEAASERVMTCDAAHRKRIAMLEWRVELSEEQPVVLKVAPKTKKNRKREECRSASARSGRKRSLEMKKLKINIGQRVRSACAV